MQDYVVGTLGVTPSEDRRAAREVLAPLRLDDAGAWCATRDVSPAHFLRETHRFPGLEQRVTGHRHDLAAPSARLRGRRTRADQRAARAYAMRVLGALGIVQLFEQVLIHRGHAAACSATGARSPTAACCATWPPAWALTVRAALVERRLAGHRGWQRARVGMQPVWMQRFARRGAHAGPRVRSAGRYLPERARIVKSLRNPADRPLGGDRPVPASVQTPIPRALGSAAALTVPGFTETSLGVYLHASARQCCAKMGFQTCSLRQLTAMDFQTCLSAVAGLRRLGAWRSRCNRLLSRSRHSTKRTAPPTPAPAWPPTWVPTASNATNDGAAPARKRPNSRASAASRSCRRWPPCWKSRSADRITNAALAAKLSVSEAALYPPLREQGADVRRSSSSSSSRASSR